MLFESGSLKAQSARVDTLDVDVQWVDKVDSILVAGAGINQGVGLETKAVVYLPIYYQGEEYKNRVAYGTVIAVEDSICRVQISTATAPVRPGYRILLYGHKIAAPSVLASTEKPQPREKKPFYRRKWFWLVGGAAATAAIIAVSSGGSGSSNHGKVVITGQLP